MTRLRRVSYDRDELSEPFMPEELFRSMLETINLDCVRGGRALFRKLNLTLAPGTLLEVQGPNGSGKTSLLRIMCGLMAPENGQVPRQGAIIRKLGEDYA
jgi:heme exporter protein A